MKKSTYELVKSYVDTVFSLDIYMDKKTYLNAGKVNRKISRILLDLPLNDDDNLDIVTYTDSSDRYLTEQFNDIYEKFVKMNIHELTGITYTEFLSMSIVELNKFFKYTLHKIDILDIEPPELSDSNLNTDNSSLFN